MLRELLVADAKRSVALTLVTSVCLGAASLPLAAAKPGPADRLLPDTTLIYASVPDPGGVWDAAWNHPLRARALKTDVVAGALQSPDFLQFKAVVAVVEAQLGLTWRQAVQHATAGGLHLCIDGKTEGLALLSQAEDPASRDRILKKMIQLARDDAKSKGEDDPYEVHEYRGLTAYQAGDVIFATMGPWLLITNKEDLAKHIANAFLDGADRSLADAGFFQQARASITGSPQAWAAVNVEMMREAGESPEFFAGRSQNIVAELLLGGIQSRLMTAPFATAAIYGHGNHARLELSIPNQIPAGDDLRDYYFGPGGKGQAPQPLVSDDTVLAVSMYRDLAQMWLRAGDLMQERAVDELNQADSGLTNLFAGKDFGEEILGAIEPGVQLVVARQDFQDQLPQPAVKLPSFALVARLKDPESMRPELRRTFQSLVGFLNVAGAPNGQPQLDMDMQSSADRQLVTTRYVPEPKERESKDARINFNFSPSVGFAGKRFVVSSTKDLAVKLTEPDRPATRAEGQTVNMIAVASAPVLTQLLSDNREQLVAQNMLENGHGKAEAEAEVDGLLTLLSFVDQATLRLSSSEKKLTLAVDVDLNSTGP